MTKKIPDGKIKITEIDWQNLNAAFFHAISKVSLSYSAGMKIHL